LIDLDWFFHNDAVRTEPCAGSDCHVDNGAVSDAADVGLGVDRERSFLPLSSWRAVMLTNVFSAVT